jgi:hypothetical protein
VVITPEPTKETTMKTKRKTTKTAASTNGTTKSHPRCLCGCKETTGGGRFRMGHDQRLKGILLRAHRSPKGLSARQQALVAELGWEKYIK